MSGKWLRRATSKTENPPAYVDHRAGQRDDEIGSGNGGWGSTGRA